MLNWISKSLTIRITIILFILALLLGGGAYFFWDKTINFPLSYSLIGLAVFLLLFNVVIYKYIARPLKKILKQMKLLITGRSYQRIYTDRLDEVGVIAQFFNDITENLESISNKLKEQIRMSSELEIASNIQRTILPDESPKIPGLEVVAKTRPAVEVGGDSFDFIQRGDNTFLYIGDVTGHGVPAGLVMMMVNTLLHTYSEKYDNLYDIVVNTNRLLKPRIKAAMFMTMVMLKWDHQNQKMSYVGAGHEHILIFKANTGKLESQVAGGVALGMVPDNSKLVKEKEIELEKDDIIILYTDGIIEAKNDKGEMYGMDKFKESIKRHAVQYGAAGISHHVSIDFSNFAGEAEQEDDITLIVMKYTGKEEEQPGKAEEKSTKW